MDFFASPDFEPTGFGEGKIYLGSLTVTTEETTEESVLRAEFVVSLPAVPLGYALSATATDASGNTSEFSERLIVGDVLQSMVTVNATDDTDDGICDDQHCSLREAIHETNNFPGMGTILFDLGPNGGTILPQSSLPEVTGVTLIDGSSQPGYSGVPLVELQGTILANNTFKVTYGLRLDWHDITVRALIVNRFSYGIYTVCNSTNTNIDFCPNIRVEGSYIGTDRTGTQALGNGDGIVIGTRYALIGGSLPISRNLISGNIGTGVSLSGYEARVQGNFIGSDLSGTQALGNANGIAVGDWSTIGGTEPGTGNLISGNRANGITGESFLAQGNTIGLNISRTAPLPNLGAGINSSGTGIIGGDETAASNVAGAGNVIAYNGGNGITGGSFVIGNSIWRNGGNGIAGSIRIVGNSIWENSKLGIDKGSAGVTPNDAGDRDALSNYPQLLEASTTDSRILIRGTLSGRSDSSYIIEFYASALADPSGFGEGEIYLGSIQLAMGTSPAEGVPFEAVLTATVPENYFVAATAKIFALGSTSEFSNAMLVTKSLNLPLVATYDSFTTAEDVAVQAPVLINDNAPEGTTLTIVTLGQPAHGTVTLNLDQTLTYTPALNFYGVDSFNYVISDGNQTDSATVDVTVNAVNDPVVARDDSATTNEDVPVMIYVLNNDSDVEGDHFFILEISTPGHGIANNDDSVNIGSANPGSTVFYKPASNFSGVDLFTYTLSDGLFTATATVTVTVAGNNDAPVAVDDMASTDEDVAVAVDVLANDSDADGDALSIVTVSSPDNGSATHSESQLFYTPTVNFQGLDSFSYTLSDGNGGTATGTVTVTVRPVNVPPQAHDQSVETDENSRVDILLSATDVDGDSLVIGVVAGPSHGQLGGIAPSVIYTPNVGFSGFDRFTFAATDGISNSATATVSITVRAVNQPPVAVDDLASTLEDVAVTVAVLTNDSDLDGDGLSIPVVGVPDNGAVTIQGMGIVYTPTANFHGTDHFTYTVSDSLLAATAWVTVTVESQNDAPYAADDSATTGEETTVTLAVLTNDTDVDRDPLVLAAIGLPGHGTAVEIDGAIAYTPQANFTGTDVFTYSISDGALAASASVTVTVAGENNAPMAGDDTATTDVETPVTLDALANDSDPDGDSLSIVAVGTAAHGIVIIANNTLVYTPQAEFDGVDSFTYIASDGILTDTARVTVTVGPVNHPPKALDDEAFTTEGTMVHIKVLSNDLDVDGDTLTLVASGTPNHGALIDDGSVIAYTPANGFAGTDTFTYTVSDGSLTASARVTVSITAVNEAPVAADDSATTAEDTPTTVESLTNDRDPDGDTLNIHSVGSAAHGNVTRNDNRITYTPTSNYHGADSFTYIVSDGAITDSATINVIVTPVNDAPAAANDQATTQMNTQIIIDVLDNDTDVDDDILTVQSVGSTAHGTVAIADNQLNYTPQPNYYGSDTFTYVVTDGNLTAIAAVTMTVTPVVGNTCNLYPIALHKNSLNQHQMLGRLITVSPGIQPGNFGWLSWDGSNSTSSLVASLTLSGTSYLYVDPNNTSDRSLSAGDWVSGMSGVKNSQEVRQALDRLKTVDIIVPVWDKATKQGSNIQYRVSAYARIRIVNYELSGQSGITIRYLGAAICESTQTSVLGIDAAIGPSAEEDAYITEPGVAVTADTLANDLDPASGGLILAVIRPPLHGEVTIQEDNTFFYIPAEGFAGLDEFTYQVTDANGAIDWARIVIAVESGPGGAGSPRLHFYLPSIGLDPTVAKLADGAVEAELYSFLPEMAGK